MDRLFENLVNDLEPTRKFPFGKYLVLSLGLSIVSVVLGLVLANYQGLNFVNPEIIGIVIVFAALHVASIASALFQAIPGSWFSERIPAYILPSILAVALVAWGLVRGSEVSTAGFGWIRVAVIFLGFPIVINLINLAARGGVTGQRQLKMATYTAGLSLSAILALLSFGNGALLTILLAAVTQLVFLPIASELFSSKQAKSMLELGKSLFSQGLNVGEDAPNFFAETNSGSEFSFDQAAGKKTWLIFYRYAKCPLCRYHIWRLKKKFKALREQGINVVAVFENAPDKFSEADPIYKDLDITLVADPEKKIYRRFGVGRDWTKVFRPMASLVMWKANFAGIFQGPIDGHLATVPQHYLIDETGVVRDHYVGKHIADHIPTERVETFVNPAE